MSAEIIILAHHPRHRRRHEYRREIAGRTIDVALAGLIRERQWTAEQAICWLYDNRICLSLGEAVERVKGLIECA